MGKLYKRGGVYYADYFDRSGERVRTSTRTGDLQVARQRLRDLELGVVVDMPPRAPYVEPMYRACSIRLRDGEAVIEWLAPWAVVS